MYTEYFGLRDNPFSIAPDPRYVYMSPHHQEALGHLLYGTGEDGGFVQLTGEVGTGKTTLIRTLLDQQLEEVDVALTLNPRLTVHEFLASVCDELHISYPRDCETLKPLIDALNEHLLKTHAAGRRTVLIIDEAQNLSRDVLEQVRLLTNLETNREKLLRIMLIGQPELREMLARDDLRQLSQRITARYHLGSLSRQQTSEYVSHRLKVAGGHADLFTRPALNELHRISKGIPRLINVICDRALLGAYSQNRREVDRGILKKAASEVMESRQVHVADENYRKWMWALAMVTSIAAGIALFLWRPMLPVMERTDSPPVNSGTTPSVQAPVKAEPEPLQPLKLFGNEREPLSLLVSIWGVALPESEATDCETLGQAELHCLEGNGDWALLRQYDLPAMLKLAGEEGGAGWVVLTGIQSNVANLEAANGLLTMSLSELGEYWTGAYRLLWKPETAKAAIGPASSQADINWLHKRLQMYEGQKTAVKLPYTYDEAMRQRVRRFQKAEGLEPDGMVGERTLILLNQLAPAAGTPALSRYSGGKG